MALFEIMEMDDDMRELVMKEASTAVLRDHARRRGMRSLRESGMLAIYDGLTTIDEVVRETLGEEDVPGDCPGVGPGVSVRAPQSRWRPRMPTLRTRLNAAGQAPEGDDRGVEQRGGDPADQRSSCSRRR
jgi:hypothetical protein